MSKKGQLADSWALIITIGVLGITLPLLWVMFDSVQTSFQNTPALNITENQDILTTGFDTVKNIDTYFAIAVVGAILVYFMSAFLIPTTPLFGIIFFIGNMILWLLTPVLSNIYETISTTSLMQSATASNPLIDTVMLNLPLIIMSIILLGLLVFYGKRFVLNGE